MSPSLWRTITWLSALTLITLPVIAVVNGWVGSERWPLSTVRIEPAPGQARLERTDLAVLRDTLTPFAEQGYFAISLEDAQHALSEVPWVQSVRLRKYWPDILDVHISEHRPFAHWGEDQILTEQGRLFPAQGVPLPDGLPQLDGPEAQAAEVVRLYITTRTLFAAQGIDIERLALDARGSWRFTLSSGTEVILGSRDTPRRLRRFARMLPGLLAQSSHPLQRADLRYSNGFALLWTTQDPPSTT